MSEPFTNFASFIQHLIETHDEGVGYQMAKRLGVSSATVYMWRDGTIKRPQDEILLRLCEVYKQDQFRVFSLVTGMKLRGGSLAKRKPKKKVD
jgi:transcriptional regulator with XRE-family HTH domain